MNYFNFSKYPKYVISIFYFLLIHFVHAVTDEDINNEMIKLAYSKNIYKNIGRLYIYEDGKEMGHASITYLGNQTCLSAGHNFYRGQNRTYRVGFELQEGVFTFYNVDKWEMHPQFEVTGNFFTGTISNVIFDIVMLHLTEPVFELSGIEPCYDSIADVIDSNGQDFANDIYHSLEKSDKRKDQRQKSLVYLTHVGYGAPYRRMTRCEQKDGKRRANRSYFLEFVDNKNLVSLFSSPAPLQSHEQIQIESLYKVGKTNGICGGGIFDYNNNLVGINILTKTFRSVNIIPTKWPIINNLYLLYSYFFDFEIIFYGSDLPLSFFKEWIEETRQKFRLHYEDSIV